MWFWYIDNMIFLLHRAEYLKLCMKVFITYSKNNKMLVLVHFSTSTEKRSYLKLLYNVVECEYCKSNQRTFSCQYISGYNYYLFGYLFFIFSSCFFLFFFPGTFSWFTDFLYRPSWRMQYNIVLLLLLDA